MTEKSGGASSQASSDPKPKSRLLKYIAAVIGALVIAFATAVGTGLGSRMVESMDGDPELVSYSAKESINECGTSLFVREPRASELRSEGTRRLPQWPDFRRENKASQAGTSLVDVSVQGESARPITLTGISFSVERRPRPPGATFANPCGGGIPGRSVAADLDREPVAIIRSSSDPDGNIGVLQGPAVNSPKPIRFPWTVSLTDPLQLSVATTTKRCYCTWRAEIPWSSGGKSGVIHIDNGGKGYDVVGDAGVPHLVSGGTSGPVWRRFGR